jgi:type VI secretion system protein ImpE
MDELEIKGISLKSAMAQVKANPTNADLRIGLFRLFSLTGQWDRAVTQLTAAMELKADNALYSKAFLACIACERFRAEVFAGKRMALLVGEPAPWIGLMGKALESDDPSDKIRWWDQALDEAPTTPGRLNGEPFEWIADADSRLGPVLEAFLDGKYYWLPFSQLLSVKFHAPVDLIETIWQSAEIEFENGGTKSAYLPARYPGSEKSLDVQVVRAAKTEWKVLNEQYAQGLGQKILVTDRQELPILECLQLELSK